MKVSNQQTIKHSNRATVLNFIRLHELVSRPEISRELGLSPSTTSAAVTDLISRGLVREGGHGLSTGGRRPIMLEINPEGGLVISVDVTSSFEERALRAALVDLKGNVLTQIKRQQLLNSNAAMLQAIQDIISQLTSSSPVKLQRALAVGISVPGLVNMQSGELVFTTSKLEHLPLGETLSKQLQAPVFVQNSEDAAALGEYYFGTGHDCHSLVYLSVGTGIGMGLVIEGNLYPYGRTSAGEIGHLTVQPDGPICLCGNRGCLSALVNSRQLAHAVQTTLHNGYTPSTDVLAVCSPEDVDIHLVVKAAAAGETLCNKLLQEAADRVGIAVAAIINLLNPEVIVLGGEMFEVGNLFFSLVKVAARCRSLNSYLTSTRLIRSTLGRSAGLKGASVLALESLFRNI